MSWSQATARDSCHAFRTPRRSCACPCLLASAVWKSECARWGPKVFSAMISQLNMNHFFAFLGIIDPSSPLPLRGHQAQVTKCYMINVVVLFRLSVAARAMELQTVSTVGINQIRSHVRKKLKASCKSQVYASRFCFKDLMMTRLRTQHVCFSAGTALRVPRGVQVWCRWHGDVCLRRCFITSFFSAIPILHHLGNLLLTKRV